MEWIKTCACCGVAEMPEVIKALSKDIIISVLQDRCSAVFDCLKSYINIGKSMLSAKF
jgi:DNA-binding HxlR family transcriptional regulator